MKDTARVCLFSSFFPVFFIAVAVTRFGLLRKIGYHSVHLRFRFRGRAQKLASRYCSLLGAFAVFPLSLGGVVFSGRSVRIPFGFVRHGADATRVLWRLFPFFGGTR